jgi:iron-sulfur cluster assembly accessory protein
MNTQAMIEFTPSALAQVKQLLLEEKKPDLKLRVFASAGGCCSPKYGMTFETAVNDDDTCFEVDGVVFLVNAASKQQLAGAIVDFVEGPNGLRFTIKNPNAKSGCGCGGGEGGGCGSKGGCADGGCADGKSGGGCGGGCHADDGKEKDSEAKGGCGGDCACGTDPKPGT